MRSGKALLGWGDSKRRAAVKVRSRRGQISSQCVPPWRGTHPQLCLHLAYIPALTDLPTPAVPLLRDLTISSSWGSARRSSAAKLHPTRDFGPRTTATKSPSSLARARPSLLGPEQPGGMRKARRRALKANRCSAQRGLMG